MTGPLVFIIAVLVAVVLANLIVAAGSRTGGRR